MSKLFKAQLVILLAAAVFLGLQAQAQVTSTTGSGTTSFGNFSWQVDRAPITTTLNATAGFNTPPPGNLFTTNVNVASPFTIHEIHGTFTLVTWNAWTGSQSSCGNGSIIVQVIDQNGNAIASIKLQVLGPNTTNVPIEGTFSTPLSVTAMQLQFNVDQCGPQTISLALVMS